MKKASLVMLSLVLLSTSYLALTILPVNVRATTLYVGGTGPGNFTTIQSAIDAAIPGDTVYVYNGTYFENVIVDKTLSLMGEDRDATIIDGGPAGDVVGLTADWVNVSRFTVINGGIRISGSNGSVISNVTVTGSGAGIMLTGATNCTIHSNEIFSNSKMGIWTSWFSNHNKIYRNVVSDSLIGIEISVWSEYNDIQMNRISNNDYGIWIDELSRGPAISYNSFLGNAILAIYSKNPTLLARHNYFGTLDASKIEKMVKDIDCSDFLSEDPTGRSLEFIYDQTWTGTVTVDEATVVSGNLTISDATVVFNHPEAENIIQVNGNLTIEDSRIESSNGNFTVLYVNGSGGHITGSYFLRQRSLTIHSNGISVVNNNFSQGHIAVYLGVDSHSNEISGNHMTLNTIVYEHPEKKYGIIRLHGSADNIISENLISFNRGWSILVSSSERIQILNNTIHSNSLNANAIRLEDSRSITILRNEIFNNSWAGVAVGSSSFITVSQNTIYDNWWGIVGSLVHSTVSNNTFFENMYNIMLSSSNNNTIIGNEVYSNEVDGIEMRECENETIKRNVVYSNKGRGLDLHVISSLVEENEIFGNNYSGIHLMGDNNIISANNISGNLDGIHLWYRYPYSVRNNTLVGNKIQTNTGTGILLEDSSEATIYHNYIVDNGIQASDNGNSNLWDNGYPTGGNYWSDYTGNDQFSGPNQDLPGSDGIGDAPYTIDSDSQDKYPLMVPSQGFNNLPTASFTLLPTTGNVTTTFTADASLSSDLEDPITSLEVRWDWEDDGSWDTIWSTTKIAQHKYINPGDYTIRLEVKDTGGLTNSTTRQVEVVATPPPANQQPICSINDPTSEDAISGNYTIVGEASDPDGTVEIVEIRIDDGHWIEVSGTTSWSYDWDTTEVSNGIHTIYARSYDGTDHSIAASVQITVDNAPLQESDRDVFWMTAGVILVIAIVILLIILVLVLRKRKQKEEPLEPPPKRDLGNRL